MSDLTENGWVDKTDISGYSMERCDGLNGQMGWETYKKVGRRQEEWSDGDQVSYKHYLMLPCWETYKKVGRRQEEWSDGSSDIQTLLDVALLGNIQEGR